ncbi:hypothetical protein [Flavobacterium sp. MK4S-17]|uniref:hypothetical protein n=1 Tax=Flavobacterium sp. MK4S-17 TaxID=2543737 RepID=UPI00135B0A30|nr:hypothetical protein [Flavobacterium sp. MK4S-17]
MHKLNLEQLKFIDTYLKNSGIEYVDVRIEMTDHVASAIEDMEGDFLDCFKEYMLQHKKELLKSKYNFMCAARKKGFKYLGKTMVSPLFTIIFLLLSISLAVVIKYEGPRQAIDIFMIVYSLIVITIFIHFFYNYGIAKIKYSVSDRLLTSAVAILYWIVMVLHPERIIKNEIVLSVYYAFIFYFLIAVYYTFIKLINKYKLQYK